VRSEEGGLGRCYFLQIILALLPRGGFAHLLNGRQQQPDEYRDDCDNYQKRDKRETGLASVTTAGKPAPVRFPENLSWSR